MKKISILLFLVLALMRGYAADADWFVTLWDTTKNTSGTIATDKSISFVIGGNNVTVEYQAENTTTPNIWTPMFSNTDFDLLGEKRTYSFPTAGRYKVRFSKEIVLFNGGGIETESRGKMLEVIQWGTARWRSMHQGFYKFIHLNITATDIPNFSSVDSFYQMFEGCKSLVGNPSFNQWDTSSVTNMQGMFEGAILFNQPIGSWDTSKVTSMRSMFNYAEKFNQPISNWDTGKVTDMVAMFYNAYVFNQPIGNWDTSKVTNMEAMFYNATKFDQPIGDWDTGNVTNMSAMFKFSHTSLTKYDFNQDISRWNTSKVKNMSQMFYRTFKFNQPIGNWDTGNVTDMSEMFYIARLFNQDISRWNTGKVTNMRNMFYQAEKFNQDIGNWDTSSVTNMAGMFQEAQIFNQDISRWNTGNVTDMRLMFSNAYKFNQPIGHWDTSKVTNMRNMFQSAYAFNQPIGNWNTSMVTNMGNMFDYAGQFNQDIGNWDTSRVTDMNQMFRGTDAFNQDISRWNTSRVTNMLKMFESARVFNQPIGNWDTSKVTNMFDMFRGAYEFNQPIGDWDTSNVTNMRSMFLAAQKFNQDLSRWNTSKVTDMREMFKAAYRFNQSLGNWDIRKVKDIKDIFAITSMSAYNIDKTLISWNQQGLSTTKTDQNFGLSEKFYCNQEAVDGLRQRGFIITATQKCGVPGTIQKLTWRVIDARSNPILLETLVGIKETGGFEWLAEYDALSSANDRDAGKMKLHPTEGKITIVATPYEGTSFSTRVFRTYTLINKAENVGVDNVSVLSATQQINGQSLVKGKIVYYPYEAGNATSGHFYEGTNNGWERIDN